MRNDCGYASTQEERRVFCKGAGFPPWIALAKISCFCKLCKRPFFPPASFSHFQRGVQGLVWSGMVRSVTLNAIIYVQEDRA